LGAVEVWIVINGLNKKNTNLKELIQVATEIRFNGDKVNEFNETQEGEWLIKKETDSTITSLKIIVRKPIQPNIDIKKIEVFSLKFDEKLIEDELLYTKNNLINNYSLLIKTIVPETIPNLKVKWETSKGELGEYTFNNNGYNGNVDISSYKYKLTFKRKILSIFKL